MDVTPLSNGAVSPATYAPMASASTSMALADQLTPPPGSAVAQTSISITSLFLILLVVFGVIWYIGMR